MPYRDVQAIHKIEEYGIRPGRGAAVVNELAGWHYEFMTKEGKVIVPNMEGLGDIIGFLQEKNPSISDKGPANFLR